MASSHSNGGGKNERIVLTVCLAAGLAVAAWGGCADRSEAAGLSVPRLAARDGIVLAQTSDQADKKPTSGKTKKRRSVRCGGPGLPDCPKM
jgi:hypothetical protein